jgi:hypothetical protein
MFAWEKHIKIWQLVGAVLAVPASIAGSYSVYRNYVSGGVSCGELRGSIISVLDKNLAADVKRTLLREDVDKFEKNCGDKDPDARMIFHAAVAPPSPAQNAAGAAQLAAQPTAIFGLSKSGEKRGWVNLLRRNPDGYTEANFDGATIAANSLPAVGTVLTARLLVAVWLSPPPPGQVNESTALQGRIAVGTCVKILTQGPPGRPFWAEVAPETCKKTD